MAELSAMLQIFPAPALVVVLFMLWRLDRRVLKLETMMEGLDHD